MSQGAIIAIAAVALVGIAIGAVLFLKERQRAERLDPGQQIGAGVGLLVSGIFGAVAGTGSQ